jgi:hypothetical protein
MARLARHGTGTHIVLRSILRTERAMFATVHMEMPAERADRHCSSQDFHRRHRDRHRCRAPRITAR